MKYTFTILELVQLVLKFREQFKYISWELKPHQVRDWLKEELDKDQ